MSCKIFWSQKDEKILLVKDSKGTIIASAEHLPGEDVSAGVVLDEGQKLEEICVPDDYEFDQVKRLQVVRDTKGTIVATSELDIAGDVPAEFVLEKGQKLEELEVAGNYILELDSFLKEYSNPKK
jgi:hypothetical protein